MSDDRQRAPEVELTFASIHFPPYFGGAAVRFLRYMPGLRERGVRGTVFSATPSHRDAPDAPPSNASTIGTVSPPEAVDGTLVHRVALPEAGAGARSATFFGGLSRFVRSQPRRASVVHTLNLHWSAARHLWRIRAAGIPVVYSHTLIAARPSSRWRRALHRYYASIPYRFIDVIVASTEIMRTNLREMGVRGRIEVIPNGVDLRRFRPDAGIDRARIRSELGIGEPGRVILNVGAVEPRKRVDLLLEAFAVHATAHPADHLIIAGPRYDIQRFPEFHRKLSDLIDRAGLVERVHFVGQVRDVETYYRAADLFVLTTSREGQNNAVFEAMACELPVLMTPFRGREAIHGEDGRHHVLCEADAEILGERIGSLLDAPEEHAQLARRGRAWAEEVMDVEKVLDRYAAIYQELARRS